jgi:hypothetical protein
MHCHEEARVVAPAGAPCAARLQPSPAGQGRPPASAHGMYTHACRSCPRPPAPRSAPCVAVLRDGHELHAREAQRGHVLQLLLGRRKRALRREPHPHKRMGTVMASTPAQTACVAFGEEGQGGPRHGWAWHVRPALTSGVKLPTCIS